MASTGGSAPPRKPWEGAQSAVTGPSPFRPATSEANSTAAVVESAGVADSADKNAISNPMHNGSQPPMPPRGYGGVGYNQYNSNAYAMTPSYGSTYNSYNRGYGLNSGMYGGGYGVNNGMYGGGYGSYGGGMYGSNYGGGMYGSPYGTSMGMGTGMGMGMGMGAGMGMGMSTGMGMGMGMGGPPGPPGPPGPSEDPNNPFGAAGPPSFWQSLLHKMHWMVAVFSNVAGLISENTQTFTLITTALLQFFERSGMLAGFVLKLLRMWSGPKALSKEPRLALSGPKRPANLQIEGPKSLGGAWDNVWTNELAG